MLMDLCLLLKINKSRIEKFSREIVFMISILMRTAYFRRKKGKFVARADGLFTDAQTRRQQSTWNY